MARTLKELRSQLQTKLNNFGSGEVAIYQPSELDQMINQSINYIGYVGEKSLIAKNLFKAINQPCQNGFVDKPTDYYRFDYARLDNFRCIFIPPELIDEKVNNTFAGPSQTENKYMVDYDGNSFQVFPSTSIKMELHYIALLTPLTTDSNTSPLSELGDSFVVDWSYALALEGKGYGPEIAQPIFQRIDGLLARGGRVTQVGGAYPSVPAPKGT